jgi:NAD(P)-dependent dehydrogenase (short-subunit alcohol dehydrogenase family)
VDHRLDSARETQDIIAKEGGESLAFAADVTRAEDCRRMADTCVQTYGRIDILVNNVGIGGEDLGPVKLKEEVWDRIFAVNLKSMFLTCR